MSRTFRNQPDIERVKRIKRDNNKKNNIKRKTYFDSYDEEEIDE